MNEENKEQVRHEVVSNLSEKVMDEVEESLADNVDAFVDSKIKDSVFGSIPIVNNTLAIYRAGKLIVDSFNFKKLIDFISKFNEKNLDKNKINEYKEFLLSDSTKAEEELGRIIVLLNKTTEIEQVSVLSNLYKAFIFGNYSWDVFRQLSFANQNLFTTDYEFMHKLKDKEIDSHELDDLQKVNAERLTSTGLIASTISSNFWKPETIALDNSTYRLTYLGRLFELYSQDGTFDKKLDTEITYNDK